MKNTNDFSEVKVGDKLYSLLCGWVEVEGVNDLKCLGYPIACSDGETYNIEGEYCVEGDQTLFWSKPEVIVPAKEERKFNVEATQPELEAALNLYKNGCSFDDFIDTLGALVKR